MTHAHGHHSHHDDTMGVHGMVLVGQQVLYLSHLPMFMRPHNFQVVLEVSLDEDSTARLADSRTEGAGGIYTFKPEEFHITELLPSGSAPPARTEFTGELVRGHFEKGGEAIATATVTVRDIAYFRELDFADRATELVYILFGKGSELFLAHMITAAPDFDQLLSVNVDGLPDSDIASFVRDQVFADADRFDGLSVTIEGRENSVSGRLKPGEKPSARGHVTGRHSFLDLEVNVVDELYFEEGELAEEPQFEPTEEEKAAGFGE